jgi:very-short-patch-repair endonuclease
MSGNIARARHLRKSMSLPEMLLWAELRRSPGSINFRRQHPVAPNIIVDFYCAKAKTCIEIDGFAHQTGGNPAKDESRDAIIKTLGFAIIRIPATDVLRSPVDVASALVRHFQSLAPPSALRAATSPFVLRKNEEDC